MALHYHLGEVFHPIYKQLINDSDYKEEKDEENKRKAKLIGYKSRSIVSTTGSEKIAISFGVFFVAALTCYAVYLGMDKQKDSGSSTAISSTAIIYDAPSNDFYNEVKLPNELLPLGYVLYVTPDIDTMEFRGLVKINVKCITNTSRIILHSTHHVINKVAVKTVNVTDIEDITITHTTRNTKRDMIILSTNQLLYAGYHYDFYLGFYGNMSLSYANGIYISENTKKEK